MPTYNAFGAPVSKWESRTADFTVTPFDCNKTFSNRGAGGTVTATLPTPGPSLNGVYFHFFRHAAQSFVIAAVTADTLVISGDAAADSVTLSTIGHGVKVECDGTQWWATLIPGAAATIISGTTVAT